MNNFVTKSDYVPLLCAIITPHAKFEANLSEDVKEILGKDISALTDLMI